jgi:hypothetical protein
VAFEERTLFPCLQETLGCERLAGVEEELAASSHAVVTRPDGKPPATHAVMHKRSMP